MPKKNSSTIIRGGVLRKKSYFYDYLNYFALAAVSTVAAAAVSTVTAAAVSTVVAAESVFTSVAAPPQAANAAIAKIANTFFMFVLF